MMKNNITDNLNDFLAALPEKIARRTLEAGDTKDLLEVILDLGRQPTARFQNIGEVTLSKKEVTRDTIEYVVNRLGEFDADNRAGIERTLHRFSAIRNRHGDIVGLTCRVGRAVFGTIDIIDDFIHSGHSILLLGRPGVGKTTMLREAARILAETKRVVIVDTSNEIAGDGDVPHPAIGKARRMQVREPTLQHEVMIEAVENHNPEVIVIDEIGRELEAVAARTIAERGVQLIGTAHGNNLENLLLNPTLSDLIGGIESVTLSDEEARRRGTQKTVLERRAAPTFDVLIEIQTRDQLVIHDDVSDAVDGLLRGKPLTPQLRYRDVEGDIHVEQARMPGGRSINGNTGKHRSGKVTRGDSTHQPLPFPPSLPQPARASLRPIRIYSYGVARNRLRLAAKNFNVPGHLVDDLDEADVFVTLRGTYRKGEKVISRAEERGIPIYVLRANSTTQIENFIKEIFNLRAGPANDPSMEAGIKEARDAIHAVLNGAQSVDLSPAAAHVRRLQHQMAQQADLVSHSSGKEPRRRVRIFRS